MTHSKGVFRTRSETYDGALCENVYSRKCSTKKVLFKISQNSQENNCARVFLNKVVGLRIKFGFNKICK